MENRTAISWSFLDKGPLIYVGIWKGENTYTHTHTMMASWRALVRRSSHRFKLLTYTHRKIVARALNQRFSGGISHRLVKRTILTVELQFTRSGRTVNRYYPTLLHWKQVDRVLMDVRAVENRMTRSPRRYSLNRKANEKHRSALFVWTFHIFVRGTCTCSFSSRLVLSRPITDQVLLVFNLTIHLTTYVFTLVTPYFVFPSLHTFFFPFCIVFTSSLTYYRLASSFPSSLPAPSILSVLPSLLPSFFSSFLPSIDR